MDVGLFHGVAALDVGAKRLETVTANLANVSTPAFKRLTTSTEAFSVSGRTGEVPGLAARQLVDFSQGDLRRTDNPTDLALQGSGFFAVESPSGEVYTRNGSFRIDEGGVFKTAEGWPVAWNGARGQLDAVGEQIVVDTAGNVFQGTAQVGTLRLVDFVDPHRLGTDRHGYYHASARQPEKPVAAEVHQGALEGSNVSSVDELVDLISIQRRFEHASNLMRSIDQTYKRLVQSRR